MRGCCLNERCLWRVAVWYRIELLKKHASIECLPVFFKKNKSHFWGRLWNCFILTISLQDPVLSTAMSCDFQGKMVFPSPLAYNPFNRNSRNWTRDHLHANFVRHHWATAAHWLYNCGVLMRGWVKQKKDVEWKTNLKGLLWIIITQQIWQ